MATFTIPHDAIAGYTLKMKANTAITELGAGREQRRATWGNVRRAWDLMFKKDSTDLGAILSFWEARLGSWEAFDWTDPNGVARKVRFATDDLEAGPVINGYGTVKFTLMQVFDSDGTAPEVSAVNPADGTNSKGLTGKPVIWTMSEPISPSDVTSTYFHVIDSTTGVSVPGTLSLNLAGLVVVFEPNDPWILDRVYLPRVEAGVHDLTGNKLAAAYGTHFHATNS
jgi:phage-related protein